MSQVGERSRRVKRGRPAPRGRRLPTTRGSGPVGTWAMGDLACASEHGGPSTCTGTRTRSRTACRGRARGRGRGRGAAIVLLLVLGSSRERPGASCSTSRARARPRARARTRPPVLVLDFPHRSRTYVPHPWGSPGAANPSARRVARAERNGVSPSALRVLGNPAARRLLHEIGAPARPRPRGRRDARGDERAHDEQGPVHPHGVSRWYGRRPAILPLQCPLRRTPTHPRRAPPRRLPTPPGATARPP